MYIEAFVEILATKISDILYHKSCVLYSNNLEKGHWACTLSEKHNMP